MMKEKKVGRGWKRDGWVIQMSAWVCLGFKSLKKYSQNERGSRAQREDLNPQYFYFPAVVLREAKKCFHELLRSTKHKKIWLWMYYNSSWNITFQMPPRFREIKCVIFFLESMYYCLILCYQLNFTLMSSLLSDLKKLYKSSKWLHESRDLLYFKKIKSIIMTQLIRSNEQTESRRDLLKVNKGWGKTSPCILSTYTRVNTPQQVNWHSCIIAV